MLNLKTRPNYTKLTEHLESMIASGAYRAGDKLPTLRELSDEFELTGYAVHRALKLLQEKGLVALRHGSGAYVAASREATDATWNITVFVGTEIANAGYLSCALLGIQQAAIRQGCSLTIRKRDYYEYYAPAPPLSSMIGSAHGLIFLGEYDYLEFVLPRTIPSSGVEMSDTCGGLLSPVSLDPMSAARLATDFFRRRRKRRIKVYFLQGGKAFQLRAECFRQQWKEFGEVEMLPYPLGREQRLDPVIETDPQYGLLFCSGSWCEDYLRTYERNFGGRMTDRFDILSIDGKSLIMPNYLPVSTISIDWRVAGEAALQELLRRLANPSAEARRIYLVPQLQEITTQVTRIDP